MSLDITFTGSASAEGRQVADAFGVAEDALGEERMEALEDAGLNVVWGPRELSLSIPYGGDGDDFRELVAITARELEQRFGWRADDDTSSRELL